MRKTARLVVWEGAGAQSPAPDPIADKSRRTLGLHCLGFGEARGGCRGGGHHGNAEPAKAGTPNPRES
jgi:hypothetical protein